MICSYYMLGVYFSLFYLFFWFISCFILSCVRLFIYRLFALCFRSLLCCDQIWTRGWWSGTLAAPGDGHGKTAASLLRSTNSRPKACPAWDQPFQPLCWQRPQHWRLSHQPRRSYGTWRLLSQITQRLPRTIPSTTPTSLENRWKPHSWRWYCWQWS